MPVKKDLEMLQLEIVKFLNTSPWGSTAPMRQCARSMNMSVRTLRRRLADNQTTFSEVVENWRITNARRLLSTHDMPITAIATLLGYNHSSNFERAFKRWTSLSPSDYRARSRAQSGLK